MEPTDFQTSGPGAPPPPPEVKVRTMKSDLESMARSGGGAPQFQNVAIAGLAAEGNEIAVSQPSVEEAPATQEAAAQSAPSKSMIGPILVIVVAIAALAVVGYFAYTIFYASGASQAPVSGVATSTTP